MGLKPHGEYQALSGFSMIVQNQKIYSRGPAASMHGHPQRSELSEQSD
jgi:hypothetical protein